jgi:triosephosphate isomerase
MRKPFIAGNWKMFKTVEEGLAFAEALKREYHFSHGKLGIMAPYPLLGPLVEAFRGTEIKIGAQNMHFEKEGAFTGEVSPRMLQSLGVQYCIIGHSERRQYFNETDESCNLKLKAAYAHNILPIFCVGENLKQRESQEAFTVVEKQIKEGLKELKIQDFSTLTVAYEPVWAIGTGRNATPEQADEMCGWIRKIIGSLYGDQKADQVIIQYGGSVKPENAHELLNMPEIDGALVGGASLEAASLLAIARG